MALVVVLRRLVVYAASRPQRITGTRMRLQRCRGADQMKLEEAADLENPVAVGKGAPQESEAGTRATRCGEIDRVMHASVEGAMVRIAAESTTDTDHLPSLPGTRLHDAALQWLNLILRFEWKLALDAYAPPCIMPPTWH